MVPNRTRLHPRFDPFQGIPERSLGPIRRPDRASPPLLPLHREDAVADLTARVRMEAKLPVQGATHQVARRGELRLVVNALCVSEASRGQKTGCERLHRRIGGISSLSYIGSDNQRHRPHIIHRAPLGTHERFVAFLIENYGGVFPTWLAPVQVRIIPVAPAFADYAHKLRAALREDLVRAEVDDSQESLGKKIRNGATSKITNLFIVGQQEQDDQAVSWKRHGERQQATHSFEKAREMLATEIANRTDWRNSQT